MSQRLTPKNILGKPVTKRELLDVLQIFEQNIDRKIWAAIPWYTKLWRYFRGPYRAKRRQARLAQKATRRSSVSKHPPHNGDRPVQAGAP